MKNNKFKRISGIFMFAAFFAGITVIAMLLWNALIPGIFGITTINFLQTAGLLILARLFLGGMGHGPRRFIKKRGGSHKFGPWGNNELRDKLRNMSHNERREYIREHMNRHFNNWDEYSEFNNGDNDRKKD